MEAVKAKDMVEARVKVTGVIKDKAMSVVRHRAMLVTMVRAEGELEAEERKLMKKRPKAKKVRRARNERIELIVGFIIGSGLHSCRLVVRYRERHGIGSVGNLGLVDWLAHCRWRGVNFVAARLYLLTLGYLFDGQYKKNSLILDSELLSEIAALFLVGGF